MPFSGKIPCLPGPPKQKTYSTTSSTHSQLHQFSHDQISKRSSPYSPMQVLLASGLFSSKMTTLSPIQAEEPEELNRNTGQHNWSASLLFGLLNYFDITSLDDILRLLPTTR